MSELTVNVTRLEAMRVVCFNGFGPSPEGVALQKLAEWAAENRQKGRVFGYNNPSPAVGSPNYGYDAWMQVDRDVTAPQDARVIDFPGGLYGVARVHVNNPEQDIPEAWHALVRWMEENGYQHGQHQWLEEQIEPDNGSGKFVLDLFLPLQEQA